MLLMLLCLYCQIKKHTSKYIKTNEVEMEIQQKCFQQDVYYIEGKKEENKYGCLKRR